MHHGNDLLLRVRERTISTCMGHSLSSSLLPREKQDSLFFCLSCYYPVVFISFFVFPTFNFELFPPGLNDEMTIKQEIQTNIHRSTLSNVHVSKVFLCKTIFMQNILPIPCRCPFQRGATEGF